jgi:nucleoside-diphosphate-sugar epimerase
VLVTGLGGFTGPYLRRALERAGHEVVAAGDPPAFDLSVSESVARAVRFARPDYVVHLAGISFVPHGDPARLYAVNTVGTSHLLEAIASEAPMIRKVILASSANVYGNVDSELIEESAVPRPVNHYGCSKLSMECLARTWYERIPLVIVRPFNYTGPGQSEHFLVPKLVMHFARRAPAIRLGNLDVERDFSDVRMVCDAYRRLLSSSLRSTEVNVCSGVGRSLRWVLAELAKFSGYCPRVEVDPSLVRAAEVRRLVGDNERLRQTVGELEHTDFCATLRWMFDEAALTTERAQNT